MIVAAGRQMTPGRTRTDKSRALWCFTGTSGFHGHWVFTGTESRCDGLPHPRVRSGDCIQALPPRMGSELTHSAEPSSQCPGLAPIDLTQVSRDALAVYYFPGCREWDRAIVQPLVHQALSRSVRGQAEAMADDQARQEAWTGAMRCSTPTPHGRRRLTLSPRCAIDIDFEVNIPDPATPGTNRVTPAGDEIRYCGPGRSARRRLR